MQLVDLVVLACTLANPAACRNHHILFSWQGSLRTCTMYAESQLVEWSKEHPNLRIVRWHCAWPNQEGEKS